jgi:hypothetical protein
VLLCLAFLALYAALGQHTFYKTDGIPLVHLARTGPVWGSVHHPLYVPLLHGLDRLLELLGASPYRSALAFSALGSVLGVALAHAGLLRLGLARRSAALAAGLAGLAPAVLFFATVVEYHGPFFGAAGLAFWCMARAAQRPSPTRALALALATYFAASLHATGHLLPSLTSAWLLALGFPSLRWRALVAPCIAGAAHVVLLFGVPALTRALGNAASPDAQAAFFAMQEFAPLDLPLGFAREWLLPFAPLSLVLFWRPREPALRLEWYALLAACVPYALLSWALNTGYNPSECGAYWLPLALPAARLAVAQLPRAAAVALALVCAGTGLWQIARHDDPSANRAWIAGFDAARAGRPAVPWIGHSSEAAALLIERPDQEFLSLDFVRTLGPEAVQAGLPLFAARVETWRREGKELFLCASGRELLALLEPRSGPALRLWLEREFQFEPIESGPFRGERLVPRR